MKKNAGFILGLLLCLGVSGCAGQTQKETQTEKQTETSTQQTTEMESETETEAATEASEREPVNTVIGSLVDLDLKQLVVLSDNGNEIIFPIKGAELDFRGGFRVGNLVSVEYTGQIVSPDSRKADISVRRVADSADVQELKEEKSGNDTESEVETETAGSQESESGSEQEPEEIKSVQGKIQKMNLNSITILTDDKKKHTFGIMNARMYFAKGIKKGVKVTVTYRGELLEEETKVISVTEKENE